MRAAAFREELEKTALTGYMAGKLTKLLMTPIPHTPKLLLEKLRPSQLSRLEQRVSGRVRNFERMYVKRPMVRASQAAGRTIPDVGPLKHLRSFLQKELPASIKESPYATTFLTAASEAVPVPLTGALTAKYVVPAYMRATRGLKRRLGVPLK